MKKFLLTVACVLAMTGAARADVVVWTDPADGLTLSYPHEWMRQTNTNPDMHLKILAPHGDDFANCRLMVVDDGSFLSTPADGQAEVTNFYFNENTVQAYLGQEPAVSNVALANYKTDAGLGHGPATQTFAEYTRKYGSRDLSMKAIALFGQHRGVKRALVCESLAQAWGRWLPVFENIVRSVEFPAAYGTTPNGYYRPFQKDGGVQFPTEVRKTGRALEQ